MQVVAHNLVSQFTSRQLNVTTTEKRKSLEKLSSGYRINRSADDAAGLQISEKMRNQIRGLNQASGNIQDAISLCQVADGALNESHSILQRMRELSVQAANDTNTEEDRAAIQKEIDQLTKEVDRIAKDTNFNEGIYPLKGNLTPDSGNNVQKSGTVINSNGDNLAWSFSALIDVSSYSSIFSKFDYGFEEKAGDPNNLRKFDEENLLYAILDKGMEIHADDKLVIGTQHKNILFGPDSHLHDLYALNTSTNQTVLISEILVISPPGDGRGAYSQLFYKDTQGKQQFLMNFTMLENGAQSQEYYDFIDGFFCDINKFSMAFSFVGNNGGSSGNGTVSGGNQGIWIQTGANSGQGLFLSLVNATAKGIGITDPALDVTNYDNASTSISRLDNAINKVSSYRSHFGAQQNRLEYAKAVDDNTAENTQYAESRIRDADMAEEMVNYSKHSILEQAGTAILAQANQSTQGILSLLQ